MAVEQKKWQVVASIVLFNHSYPQIENTLNSLLAESCVSKVVLVDNGGGSWASKLANPRIDYITSERNGGFAYGHNLAMARYLSDSHYFLICNPDISFEQGELEKLYQFACMGKHQFVAPKIHYSDGRFQYSCRLLPSPVNLFLRRFLPRLGAKMDAAYELHQADYSQNLKVPSISGCFMLLASELLQALQGFDERYFMYLEDVDLCRRALPLTDIIYHADSLVIHVFGKGSYKNRTLLFYHLRSAITYFNTWGWFFDSGRKGYNQLCLQKLPRREE